MTTKPAVVDCALYVGGVRQPADGPLDELYERARGRPDAFVWIGLHEPDPGDFRAVEKVFGLHPLAVEDALNPNPQRPKVERYEDVTFLVVRTARYLPHGKLTETSEVIDTGSVRLFLGPHFVVTVRHGESGELRAARLDLEAHPAHLAAGPWAVVHAVLDKIVDGYLAIAGAFDTDVAELEAAVFRRDSGISVERVYQLKRELMEFRTAAVPLQRPLLVLLDKQTFALPKEIRRYFRDVNDHQTRVVEQIVNHDDILNSILQARLAQVTVDQNNDMRKIASWAAIAALQTAIAGIYGMNFAYMPELHWRYGYPAVLAVMLGSGLLLHRVLRRNGWL
ncbi:magnesium and cobalt transport protein CorA [Dactylosporangium roseum]|uniref:Magnesium and cobalt transport protein CorA n=1 Tax=Dactylosporangium roseum TaxID=47989 RepID=A0ABY5YVE8_9ACTN|nr:magnesium and cobalt transport protein CorA [Dactylosporangium roseum]UWZ33726.1 magnesium and cobalt transport protein CorA [Dactylosporangium roseum]